MPRVTPRYVAGLTPRTRELPIIAKIAHGSLRNKLLFLLPGGAAAQRLCALGGYAAADDRAAPISASRATEKVLEGFGEHEEQDGVEERGPRSPELETEKVIGAVRTDSDPFGRDHGHRARRASRACRSATQAVVLALVGVAITVGVYGVVGLIVKMDDIGLHLAQRRRASTRALGRGLVKACRW